MNAGTLLALRDAAKLCAQVFVGDQGEEPRMKADLVQECEQTILGGLLASLGIPA